MASAPLQIDTSGHEGASDGTKNTPERTSTHAPNSPRPCVFFAQGVCKHGDSCRFSHDPQLKEKVQAALSPSLPPPPFVSIPPGHPVFSIDVECVATGTQHNARAIAQVALVDEWCRPVLNLFIRQELPVVSYLTPLTGITKELLDAYAVPQAEALASLRSFLSPNAILVGTSIAKDVGWLQLVQGMDYHTLIDLSDLFRVWHPSRNIYLHFSQAHVAKVWLGLPERTQHDALSDGTIAMALLNAYRTIQHDTNRIMTMQRATLTAPRIYGFSTLNPVIEGCCMGNRNKCTCGAPFD